MLLSNTYSNKIDDLVDSSDKKNVISCRQTRNATSPQLLDIERNRVAGHSKIEKGAIKKNRVVGHFEKRKGIEDINGDMSEICFFNRERTKCN